MAQVGGYIGELPGMIWDGANGRYITAQPSHLATNTQKQVERQKKENEAREREAAALVRAKKQRIVRRATLHDMTSIPVGGSRIDIATLYTPPTDHKGIALALKGKKLPRNLKAELLRGDGYVGLFDYHESFGTFVLGIHIPHSTGCWAHLVGAQPRTPSSPPSKPAVQYDFSPLVLPGIEFSSLQITPNNNVIATTFGSGDQSPQVLIIPATRDGSLGILTDVDCPYVSHTMNEVDTIWSCAVNPWTSSGIGETNGETLAVGGSGWFFHCRLTADSSLRHMGFHVTGTDIRTVEWKDVNVTAGGAHDGKVFMYDVRSRRGSLRLETVQHSINGIRFTGTGNNYMVLNGINNFMVMYDLRFPGTVLGPLTDRPTMPSPSVVYPYKNPAHYPTAFDISTPLDLVAAAESDVPGIIQVYRMSTGQKLRTIDVRPLSGSADDIPVPRCLRFKRDSMGVPMLLVAAGRNVLRFAV